MKIPHSSFRRGFTLLETVIAIGVLAVLLTGFLVVFAPAAEGVRKSISVQQADRLVAALENELVTVRDISGSGLTGFDQAFDWIPESNEKATALLIYQYRGRLGASARDDGTLAPELQINDKVPGKDYTVISMMRRRNDPKLADDLQAVEGSVYFVKCNQLVFDSSSGSMVVSQNPDEIREPKGDATVPQPENYTEAVIAFSADFYILPSKDPGFIRGTAFETRFDGAKTPVFSRNLAIRR